MAKNDLLEHEDFLEFCAKLPPRFTLKDLVDALVRECPARIADFSQSWRRLLGTNHIQQCACEPEPTYRLNAHCAVAANARAERCGHTRR